MRFTTSADHLLSRIPYHIGFMPDERIIFPIITFDDAYSDDATGGYTVPAELSALASLNFDECTREDTLGLELGLLPHIHNPEELEPAMTIPVIVTSMTDSTAGMIDLCHRIDDLFAATTFDMPYIIVTSRIEEGNAYFIIEGTKRGQSHLSPVTGLIDEVMTVNNNSRADIVAKLRPESPYTTVYSNTPSLSVHPEKPYAVLSSAYQTDADIATELIDYLDEELDDFINTYQDTDDATEYAPYVSLFAWFCSVPPQRDIIINKVIERRDDVMPLIELVLGAYGKSTPDDETINYRIWTNAACLYTLCLFADNDPAGGILINELNKSHEAYNYNHRLSDLLATAYIQAGPEATIASVQHGCLKAQEETLDML